MYLVALACEIFYDFQVIFVRERGLECDGFPRFYSLRQLAEIFFTRTHGRKELGRHDFVGVKEVDVFLFLKLFGEGGFAATAGSAIRYNFLHIGEYNTKLFGFPVFTDSRRRRNYPLTYNGFCLLSILLTNRKVKKCIQQNFLKV